MKRPPKKKHKNPLLPDDQQVDERHLIDLEDSADISFEDRAQIYWMENRGFIMGCITVLLLVVAGYQGARMYMNHKERALQAEYAAAEASGELATFAAAHPGSALGGFAALRTADAAYEAGDYAGALENYRLAAAALTDGVLTGRAQLGEAFSLYQTGEEAVGVLALNSIVADAAMAESIRAEAAYHLAIQAHANGDEEGFESFYARIKDFSMGQQWGQRLDYYRQQSR